MPLFPSWNVYNPANIARVKADEEAAAAREAAADQRMQELDAERRAAILRGRTPPPLPEEDNAGDGQRRKDRKDGHDRKRRKLRGEDDTDADIRLAASMTRPKDGDEDDAKVLKLRKPASDAPLTDHAGNIDLFPIDVKEAVKREKNAEVEKEKRKKEQAFEDQYTMRFSNAAGKNGLDQPWYAAQHKPAHNAEDRTAALEYPGFENKNVWGNEDPRRKEREQARISSNDPFAFMQNAQTQLKKSKEDKKKWTDERKTEEASTTEAATAAVEAAAPTESVVIGIPTAGTGRVVEVEIETAIENEETVTVDTRHHGSAEVGALEVGVGAIKTSVLQNRRTAGEMRAANVLWR
ncbi:hypothetical protein SLS59_007958 [Nothophoma quercina]|uniref:CBF1-interacting co-repressor CIR N-terminal domain-containing protein n=1 Tax=Nothophoma quercina TaxID=749835 RepID=A0ABR3QVS1_9PLEO